MRCEACAYAIALDEESLIAILVIVRLRCHAESAGAMTSNYLFLDTEWADWEGEELVSLGLTSADGRTQF